MVLDKLLHVFNLFLFHFEKSSNLLCWINYVEKVLQNLQNGNSGKTSSCFFYEFAVCTSMIFLQYLRANMAI